MLLEICGRVCGDIWASTRDSHLAFLCEEGMSDKNRVQFDFTKEALDHLDALRVKLDAASRAEVIRRALRLLDYAIVQKEQGFKLVIREPDGFERGLEII